MARNSAATGSVAAGSRSHSSRNWLQELRCSRLSARNSAAYFEASIGSAEDALDRLEHAGGLEGLDHDILGAGLDRLDAKRLLPHRAAHENLGVRIVPADLAHGVDAAHVRHHDVHGDQVGPERAVLLDGLGAGFGFANHLEARLREDVADHGAHEDRVIADEYGVTHAPPPCIGEAGENEGTSRPGGQPPSIGASSASVSSMMKCSSPRRATARTTRGTTPGTVARSATATAGSSTKSRTSLTMSPQVRSPTVSTTIAPSSAGSRSRPSSRWPSSTVSSPPRTLTRPST